MNDHDNICSSIIKFGIYINCLVCIVIFVNCIMIQIILVLYCFCFRFASEVIDGIQILINFSIHLWLPVVLLNLLLFNFQTINILYQPTGNYNGNCKYYVNNETLSLKEESYILISLNTFLHFFCKICF